MSAATPSEAAITRSVGQPLVVAASGNHPLLDCVTALIPWLISSSSLHPLHFYVPCEYARCRIPSIPSIPTHDAVDCIPKRYRQNQDLTPTLHDYLPRFPLGNHLFTDKCSVAGLDSLCQIYSSWLQLFPLTWWMRPGLPNSFTAYSLVTVNDIKGGMHGNSSAQLCWDIVEQQ